MSFCRWSSKPGEVSDLYVYKVSDNSFNIQVAKTNSFEDEYGETINKKINLKYAGETFNFTTQEEVIQQIQVLKDIGFTIPDKLIPLLEKDIIDTPCNNL